MEDQTGGLHDRLPVTKTAVETEALSRSVQTGNGQAVAPHTFERSAHKLGANAPAADGSISAYGAHESGGDPDP